MGVIIRCDGMIFIKVCKAHSHAQKANRKVLPHTHTHTHSHTLTHTYAFKLNYLVGPTPLTQQLDDHLRVPDSPIPAGAQSDVQDVVILAHEADLGNTHGMEGVVKGLNPN